MRVVRCTNIGAPVRACSAIPLLRVSSPFRAHIARRRLSWTSSLYRLHDRRSALVCDFSYASPYRVSQARQKKKKKISPERSKSWFSRRSEPGYRPGPVFSARVRSLPRTPGRGHVSLFPEPPRFARVPNLRAVSLRGPYPVPVTRRTIPLARSSRPPQPCPVAGLC